MSGDVGRAERLTTRSSEPSSPNGGERAADDDRSTRRDRGHPSLRLLLKFSDDIILFGRRDGFAPVVVVHESQKARAQGRARRIGARVRHVRDVVARERGRARDGDAGRERGRSVRAARARGGSSGALFAPPAPRRRPRGRLRGRNARHPRARDVPEAEVPARGADADARAPARRPRAGVARRHLVRLAGSPRALARDGGARGGSDAWGERARERGYTFYLSGEDTVSLRKK